MRQVHVASFVLLLIPFLMAKSCNLYDPTTWDINLGGQNLGSSGVKAQELNHDAFTNVTAISSTNTPGLLIPRRDHTATLLLDGRVLIVGGESNGGAVVEAEIYDQGNGEFQKAASLNTARMLHTATLLSNGRVIIAGGLNDQYTPLQSIEEYDPTLDKFTVLQSQLSDPRYGHTATLFPSDGAIVFIGGFRTDPSGTPEATDTVDIYNPAAIQGSRIEPAEDMPDTRAHHAATLLPGPDKTIATPDDRILVSYGIGSTNQAGNINYTVRTTFLIFDRNQPKSTTNVSSQWKNPAGVSGTARRWGHHALQTYNQNFDVIILAGINAGSPTPYVGGNGARDVGNSPVQAVEVFRSTSSQAQPWPPSATVTTPQNVAQLPPPMQPFVGGTGSVAILMNLPFSQTSVFRIVFIGAGVQLTQQGPVYSNAAYLINVSDPDPNQWTIRQVGLGFSATQGAPQSSPPGPNPGPGNMTIAHAFSAISPLPGPDGFARNADDTLLICGGQETGPTQIQNAEIYTFPREADMP